MRSTLDPLSLRAEIEEARESLQRGEPAEARRRFRLILGRLDRRTVEEQALLGARARLLLGLAIAEFEITGDLDSAMSLLADAESAAVCSGTSDLQTPIQGQRALLLLRRGETSKAMAAFDKAVSSLGAAATYDQMTVLLNRGALHLEHGSAHVAAADFDACVALAETAGEDLVEYKARHNLGYAEFIAGRLPRAIAALDAARSRFPGEEPPIAALDRARVLREAGLVRDADAILAHAADLFARRRLYQDLGETELARAECALVEGRGKQARVLAASARRRFARRGNTRWQRKAELLLVECARLAAEEKQARARRTALRAAAGEAAALVEDCRRESRRDLARRAALLAQQCALQAGEDPELPLPSVRSTDTVETRLLTREVRALAALEAGTLGKAAIEVRRGLAELADYQHSFGSLDLRTASAVHGKALARLGLDVAMRSGSPAAVLHLVEQSRAVSTRLPAVRPPGDERTAALLAELRRVEEEARAIEGEPAAADRLEVLRGRARRLQREIRARAWELEGFEGVAAAAPRLSHVRQQLLGTDSAFVCFARHGRRWVAVSVGHRRVRLHDLASISEVSGLVTRVRADLDALAMPLLPAAIRAVVRASLEAGLRRLDDRLVAPLRMQGRPLVISCSGDLVLLPWGLLPGREGVATMVTPSAAAWLRAAQGQRPASPRVVALAGPDLRQAQAEAHAVAERWSASALAGLDATVAAAHHALVTADLVHVAAHGRHRVDNPLFSSVRLVDGSLYAYELDAPDGVAGCVVLSACEAGLATIRPGDESLGLAHVLISLGAQSVVAGVARVSDDVSAHLMRALHRAVASGTGVASAVAQIQRESLRSDAPAAFVSLGADW